MISRQLIRRHEKTAKGPDGKKLDKPTPEGFANAYKKGGDLLNKYPDSKFLAFHSKADRTRIAAVAWLLGAESKVIQPSYDPLLDSVAMDHEAKQKLRDMSDKHEQYRKIFELYTPELIECGKNISQSIYNESAYVHSFTDQPEPDMAIKITHGPIIDVAFLTILGKPVSYESALEHTGLFKEGEGFDVAVRQEGSLYIADLSIGDSIKKTRPLEELAR